VTGMAGFQADSWKVDGIFTGERNKAEWGRWIAK
jgi:hypothetical protein